MGTLSKPFTFTGNSYAVAGQVNSDFDTLFGWVNGGSAMWADGSVPFTNPPSINSDPTGSTQAARKGYVDSAVSAAQATLQAEINAIPSNVLTNLTGGAFKATGGMVTVSVSGGAFTYTFPSAFPSSCFMVVACFAQTAQGSLAVQVEYTQVNRSQFGGRIYNTQSGANATGSYVISYVAFGT